MCIALDMPCGARGDLDHIDAKRYRMGIAHISNLQQQIYRIATGNISSERSSHLYASSATALPCHLLPPEKALVTLAPACRGWRPRHPVNAGRQKLPTPTSLVPTTPHCEAIYRIGRYIAFVPQIYRVAAGNISSLCKKQFKSLHRKRSPSL